MSLWCLRGSEAWVTGVCRVGRVSFTSHVLVWWLVRGARETRPASVALCVSLLRQRAPPCSWPCVWGVGCRVSSHVTCLLCGACGAVAVAAIARIWLYCMLLHGIFAAFSHHHPS